jgi:hypothetical protein
MANDKFRKVLDQINKLLALAANKGAYENEAANALEAARKLMLKYDIDEFQLSEAAAEIIEIDFALSHSSEQYMLRLAYYLCKAFRVTSVIVKTNIGIDKIKLESSVRFIGRKPDIAVASFVLAYMERILDIKSAEYYKTVKKKTKKTIPEYSLGFVTAVCEKLKQIEEIELAKITPAETGTVNALVVCTNALVSNYMKEKYPNTFDGKENTVKVNANNFSAGYTEGEKYGIFRGVEGHEKKKEIV